MKLKKGSQYRIALKFLLFLFVSFACSHTSAQMVTDVRGVIIDSVTGKPLYKTTLLRLSDNKVFLTDSTGTFDITCTPNDAVRISYIGFKTLRLIVKNIPDSGLAFKKFVTIEMSRNVKGINQIIISDERRPGRAADSAYYQQALKPINAGVDFSGGALEINAISMLYSEFSKKEKEKRQLTEILQQQYVTDVLNYRLPKQKIMNLTGDRNFTSDILRAHCQPSDFFLLNASDYDLYNWAKACYRDYKKENSPH